MATDPVLTVQDATSTETDGELTFRLNLSAPAPADVTVDVTPFGDTARMGVDVAGAPRRVTIPAGETSTGVNLETFGDSIAETDERVRLAVTNPQGARFADGQTMLQAVGTLRDDDGETPKPALAVRDLRIVEGDEATTTAEFDVMLSRSPDSALDLAYATTGIGAEAGSDFTGKSGTLTFRPGERMKTLEVPIAGDRADEPGESVALTVTPTDRLAGAAGAVGTARILDDDSAEAGAPTVNIGPADLREADRALRIPVTLSETAESAITLDLRTWDASAAAGADYAATRTEVTIPSGARMGYATVDAFADSLDEPDERLAVSVSNPSEGALAGDAAVLDTSAILRDDDGKAPPPRAMVADRRVVEGGPDDRVARVEVMLSRPHDSTVSLQYATRPGSAEPGRDYTATSGTVTFDPGQTRATVDVPIAGDAAVEAAETLSLVAAPAEATAADVGDAGGTVTLIDDDAGAPQASIADVVRTEGFGRMAFTVTLSEPAPEPVRIDYATASGKALANADFAGKRGTLEIEQGARTGVIEIETFTDQAPEPDETFSLRLNDATNAILGDGRHSIAARGTLRDDDAAERASSLSVGDVHMAEGRFGTREAIFDVSLSRAVDAPLSLPFTTHGASATPGTDYRPQTGTLTFEPGQTTASVAVPVYGDRAVEPTETLDLVVGGPPRGTVDLGAGGVRGTAVIADDDAGRADDLPTASIHGGRTPEGNAAVFTVRLSEAVDKAVGVEVTTRDGTATAGADYTGLTDTAVVPAGERTAAFTVRTRDDDTAEDAETFDLVATGAVGARLAGGADEIAATATIVDDDASGGADEAAPVVTVSDARVSEPASGSSAVTFTVATGGPVDEPVSGEVALRAGRARVDGDAPDVSLVTDTVTIEPGSSSTVVEAEVHADARTEATEGFVVAVENLTHARAQDGGDSAHGVGTIAANGGSESTLPLLDLSPAAQVAAVYVAYFGRAPNPAGLDFWVSELQTALAQGTDNGTALADIASAFASDTDPGEAIAQFPFLAEPGSADAAAIETFVTKVYQNLFNREPADAGLAYWREAVRDLIEGPGFVGNAIIDIVSGAQRSDAGDDRGAIRNKIDVGLDYADAVVREGAAFDLADDQGDAQDVIAGVTADPASVASARAMVAERVAADAAETAPAVTVQGTAPADEGDGLG